MDTRSCSFVFPCSCTELFGMSPQLLQAFVDIIGPYKNSWHSQDLLHNIKFTWEKSTTANATRINTEVVNHHQGRWGECGLGS